MAQKENINVVTHPVLAQRFREVAKNYDGRMGMCLSAAMVMFLEADPETQGEYLKRVFEAQIRDEVEALIEAVRLEQSNRMAAKEAGGKKKR